MALPKEVRARAAGHIARLRAAVPDVRASWDRAEKLHVTLKFLGEVEAQRAERLSSAAARAARASGPFQLTIEGTGTFPPHGPPKVLWVGVGDNSGGLARLQQRLEDECSKEGFTREQRAFHPHLTLARLRRPQGARRLAALHKEMGFAPA
ncbi:MAG TPA: RNA 2',3'-cyclic phosphodiesterase, partial [Pyrinomonadaceae bacterium]